MNNPKLPLIPILIFGVVILILIGVIAFSYFTKDTAQTGNDLERVEGSSSKQDDAKITGVLSSMRANSELYYSEYGGYTTVCSNAIINEFDDTQRGYASQILLIRKASNQ